MVFFSVPFWIRSFFIVRSVIRSTFTHETLTITPTNYRIKRTVEFRRRNGDSVNLAARAGEELTSVDRILCEQLEGAASNLTATVRTGLDDRDSTPTLASMFVDKRGHEQRVEHHMEVLCASNRPERTRTVLSSFRQRERLAAFGSHRDTSRNQRQSTVSGRTRATLNEEWGGRVSRFRFGRVL